MIKKLSYNFLRFLFICTSIFCYATYWNYKANLDDAIFFIENLQVQEHDAWLFNGSFDGTQEGHSFSAINETMVISQSDVHHRPDCNLKNQTQINPNCFETEIWKKLYLSIANDRPFKSSMHAQNGRLGWVDDGRAKEWAKHATIGDGESATIHVLHGELVLLGLFSQGHDTLFDVGVVHVLHITKDRYNQALK